MTAADNEYLFTSESVTEGHPDKIADQISDGILDAVLADDPYGRVACETLVNTGLIVVSGEISTTTYVDVPGIARETVRRIGYDNAAYGFDANTCAVMNTIDRQSPDIAQGVDRAYEVRADATDDDRYDLAGAGDQGMMFGYATNETPELMPMPISLAHKLARRLAEVRRNGLVPYLRPDGKTQVTVRYVDGRPVAVEKVLISTQHADGIDCETQIKPDLWEHVLEPVAPGRHVRRGGAPAQLHGQPHRAVRDRRADGRLRPDRAQDHRRHLRRHGPPRRRRLQRQGSDEGRPLGRLCRPLGRQDRRRRRPGRPRRGAGGLRDRHGAPGVGDGRDLRYRAHRPRAASPSSSPTTSTCAPARSARSSPCIGRSTRRRPPTATSAATMPDFTWERTDRAAVLRAAAGLGAPAAAAVSA